MNRNHNDQTKLDDFENRLRSLAPRPPLALKPLVEKTDELLQIDDGQRWWSTDAKPQHSLYRTVGISASFGALFGAVCTLLILRLSEVVIPNATAQVAASSDRPTSSIENNRDSIVEPARGPDIAHVELQPQSFIPMKVSNDPAVPHDWLEELRSLKPGTLGVGTRLVSRQSAWQPDTRNRSTFESTELTDGESSKAVTETSVGSPRVELHSVPLPQRQFMQLMLNSPNEFF